MLSGGDETDGVLNPSAAVSKIQKSNRRTVTPNHRNSGLLDALCQIPESEQEMRTMAIDCSISLKFLG
jgi:hypothetical protein